MVDSIAVRGWAVPFLDSNGDPIGDGTVEFYDAGTSDARTVYSTKDLSTTSLGTTVDLNASGILVNDSNALVNVYTGTTDYKVIIKDSASATVYTIDNIKGAIDTSSFSSGSGGFSGSVVSETSDFTVDSTYDTKVVHADPTGGEFTATFDDATTLGDGFVCGFRHDGTANQLKFATVSGQTIDVPGANAASGYALRSMGHFVTVSCDGANFLVTTETLPLGEQSPITIVDILSSPPTSPTAGAMYMLGASPSGDWSDQAEHDLAQADGQGGYIFYTPPTDCGWEAYVQDGNVKYRFEASAWVLLDDKPAVASDMPTAILAHREAQNTDGGAATSGSWETRTLNTEVSDPDGIVSISSNQFTLVTGNYRLTANAKFYRSGYAFIRLRNITDSATVTEAGPAHSPTADGSNIDVFLQTYFSVTEATEVFEIQSQVSDSKVTNGWGEAGNLTSYEEYLTIAIDALDSTQGAQGEQGAQGNTGPGYQAASTTSLTIGTGSKAFTVASGLAYTAGARVKAASDADTDNWMAGIVASYSGTTLTVTVDETNGSGTLADWNINLAGETGAAGSTGSTGSNGQVLIDYTFDSASQADSDPGSGMIRANNATPASVTAFYIDDLDRLGVDQSTEIDAFDASTSSGTKSTMYAQDLTSGSRWTYDITAVSDSSGYWEITCSHVAGTASFASNNWAITVIPRGDKGADGAGSGDVVGPASAVDTNLASFDTTTGKLIQDSGIATADVVTPSSTDTLTNKTIDANGTGNSISNIETADLASAAKTGADTAVVTGTAGTSGNLVQWNGDGDAVDSSVVAANVLVSGDIGSTVQGYDADTLKADTADVLTAGFAGTAYSAGTQSTGTFTPDEANGNLQTATNGGAHTLAPPTNSGSILIIYTNDGSAGTVTTSGFTQVTGDSLTTTNGDDFLMQIIKISTFSLLHVVALQ